MPYAIVLTDSQNCDFEVSGAVDRKGNPAVLDGPPSFSSSNEEQLTVTADPNNPNKVTFGAVGQLTEPGATADVIVSVDVKLGEEVKLVEDRIAVTIVAGEAVGITGNLGAPVEQL